MFSSLLKLLHMRRPLIARGAPGPFSCRPGAYIEPSLNPFVPMASTGGLKPQVFGNCIWRGILLVIKGVPILSVHTYWSTGSAEAHSRNGTKTPAAVVAASLLWLASLPRGDSSEFCPVSVPSS